MNDDKAARGASPATETGDPWEFVSKTTSRLSVPGGWLFREIIGAGGQHVPTVALAFVPLPDYQPGQPSYRDGHREQVVGFAA